MSARRLWLTVAVSLGALVFALAVGAAGAGAALRFGGGGTHSGQFGAPVGLGIGGTTNDVYIADRLNHRVDKFDSSGNFLLAWGWEVNEAQPADELQTCTTSCQGGFERPNGTGPGEYASEGPRGLAVDNDPLSASYGDVYVVDWENYRVQKFDPSGKFLLMFGKGVNEAGGDVCVAGEKCTAGAPGTAAAEFEWAYEGSYIAVGPTGNVYVGDRARVQVFEPTGVWQESVSLAGVSSSGQVTALAVDAAGDVYVKDSAAAGVRELDSGGSEVGQVDAGSESVQALALDEAGDVFVADGGGGFHVLEYDAAGKELASFGAGTAERAGAIAFSSSLGELYVAGSVISGGEDGEFVWVLAPPQGPLVELGSESATPGRRGKARLSATVNPEGSETTYRFEYVNEAQFKEGGYASASSTPSLALGASFADQPVSAELSGLVPGGVYHFRVVATNADGVATGSDQELTEVPPALVEGPWVTDVAATSATLAAGVDPLGTSTEYRLEYGTSNSYGQAITGRVEGEGFVSIAGHRGDLLPGTTYHYRLVTINEVGTVEGPDRTFTTQLEVGSEPALPDGRAWELVSPADKSGALIEGYGGVPVEAASDGSGIAYGSSEAIGEDVAGKTFFSQLLSTRSADGWRTSDIAPPHPLAREEEIEVEGFEYWMFSPDLSTAALEQRGSATEDLSPVATEGKLYLRNDADGSYVALLTPADVPPGTKLDGEPGEVGFDREGRARLAGGTLDLRHVLVEGEVPLTPGAPAGKGLYEWGEGQLQPVSVFPNGQPASGGVNFALNRRAGSAGTGISSDGRWVMWELGEPYGETETEHSSLYVRDMQVGRTLQIGGVDKPRPQAMSSDGSRIFYIEGGELYEFQTATVSQIDLTEGHGAGERDAGVQEAVLGTSEDGSYVYFVATGALAAGAVGGEDNIYVAHEAGSGWSVAHVATVSRFDAHDWLSAAGESRQFSGLRSRVSPNGRYLEFMSVHSLTGYDNTDVHSGQADDEVYLYDAQTAHLICASCDPTGARPAGQLDTGDNVLMDRNIPTTDALNGHWLGGIVPGWEEHFSAGGSDVSLYQPRYLSDSGRLFFDSPDALVPRDTNGVLDAYEYEPVGVGSCTVASLTFSERSAGCVSLISSGTSSAESAFFDASESGEDVFFLTASQLSGADTDTSLDVYDAHVCTSQSPCVSVPVSPPPCDSGDSCKAAPSPQPELFGAPASATFAGAGNLVPESQAGTPGPKVKAKPKRKSGHRRKPARRRGRKAARRGRVGRSHVTSGRGVRR